MLATYNAAGADDAAFHRGDEAAAVLNVAALPTTLTAPAASLLRRFKPWAPPLQLLVNVSGGDFGAESRFELITVDTGAGAMLRAARRFDSVAVRVCAAPVFYLVPRWLLNGVYRVVQGWRRRLSGNECVSCPEVSKRVWTYRPATRP